MIYFVVDLSIFQKYLSSILFDFVYTFKDLFIDYYFQTSQLRHGFDSSPQLSDVKLLSIN